LYALQCYMLQYGNVHLLKTRPADYNKCTKNVYNNVHADEKRVKQTEEDVTKIKDKLLQIQMS